MMKVEAAVSEVRREQGMYRHHVHNTYEIYYLKTGERKYFIENKTYPLFPGDFALIPKYVLHRTHGRNYERILVNFQYEPLSPEQKELVDTCFSYVIIHTPPKSRQFIEMLLERMREEYAQNGDTALLQALFTCLLMEMERFARQKESTGIQMTPQILDSVNYINKNYAEELTVEALAGRVFLSRSHFCRQFKKVTGFTPLEYIHSVRLKAAESLLESSELSITEIALRTGFSSGNYFGDIFHRYCGMSPKKWRAREKENKK